MAQVNLTLTHEEALQVLTGDREKEKPIATTIG